MRVVLLLLLAVSLLLPLAAPQAATDPAEDPRNLTWVDGKALAVGGGGLTTDDVTYLASQGFGAIADFRSEHDDPRDAIAAAHMDYLYFPIDHATDMNVTEIHQLVSWADAEIAAGRSVYIHCTNGWHRAGTFAVAWRMHKAGLAVDAAIAKETAARPGTEPRGLGALLRYQAELKGTEPLSVTLDATSARPAAGSSMPATALVHARGAPVAGASVHLYSESGRIDAHATTGADGLASFVLPAPTDATFMDFLYARATASGLADGADAVEVFYGIDVAAPTGLGVTARAGEGGIVLDLAKGGGPLHARVLAETSGGWSAFESTPKQHMVIPAPPAGGQVSIRVSSWGAASVATTTITVGASAPGPASTPSPTPAVKTSTPVAARDPDKGRVDAPATSAVATPPASVALPSKDASVVREGALAALVLGAVGAVVLLRRKSLRKAR